MLSGYKTYITAAFMIILGLGEAFGVVSIPGFTSDPGTLITAGLATFFARLGASTDAAAAAGK